MNEHENTPQREELEARWQEASAESDTTRAAAAAAGGPKVEDRAASTEKP